MATTKAVALFVSAVVLFSGAGAAGETAHELWTFEANDGGFTATGDWEWGVPTMLIAHSGSKVWGTDLDSVLGSDNGEHNLTIPNISLPSHPEGNLLLRWWDWYASEDNPGGDSKSVWVVERGGSTQIWLEDSGSDQLAWTQWQADLTPWAGATVSIQFKLQLTGVPPGPGGWYLDDVSIIGLDHYFWDLEGSDGDFTVAAGDWEWGDPTHPVGLVAHSGDRLWATALHTTAGDGMLHELVLTIPVHQNGSVLTWWDWFGAEDLLDRRRVYVDDGQQPLAEVYDNVGDQRFWSKRGVDLSPWSGQTVEILFRLSAFGTSAGPDGWYVDDLSLHHYLFADGFESGDTLSW